MSSEISFRARYKNREWITNLDNPNVEKYLSQYLNNKTKCTIMYALQALFKENRKDGLTIDDFVKLTPVQARDQIWDVVKRYVDRGAPRAGNMAKTYGTLFYQNANEEKGLTLNWNRNHKIKIGKIRDGVTPNHEQIYRLIDIVTHIDVKAMIALSYSSGLKGQGIIGLKVKTLRDAIEERERLKDEFETLLKETSDPEKRKKLQFVLETLPLYLKITPEIYGKRFTDDSKSWYPAMVCSDAEKLLMKYYAKHRTDADGNEPFFTTRNGTPYDQVYLSIKLKSALEKYYSVNKKLKNTSPSLIRRSFYNRLVAHDMKDIYREFLMGHTLGVKKHYFSWQSQKLDIIFQYLHCNFNKKNGNYGERITAVSKDLEKKDEEILELKKQIEHLKSAEYTTNLVDSVQKQLKLKLNPINVISPNPGKIIQVKIPIDSGKELAKLIKDGYNIAFSDDEFFILEKELD